MVRLNRIYTRTGDDGTTMLIGGQRVAKDHVRVEAYGTVDELNALIGLARAGRCPRGMRADLAHIQQALFNLGARLATPDDARRATLPPVGDEDVLWLETTLDELNIELPELTSFVLPGGNVLAARLHVARTVCRRAERRALSLQHAGGVDDIDVRYLNRLSDLLFVMARTAARASSASETLWQP